MISIGNKIITTEKKIVFLFVDSMSQDSLTHGEQDNNKNNNNNTERPSLTTTNTMTSKMSSKMSTIKSTTNGKLIR